MKRAISLAEMCNRPFHANRSLLLSKRRFCPPEQSNDVIPIQIVAYTVTLMIDEVRIVPGAEATDSPARSNLQSFLCHLPASQRQTTPASSNQNSSVYYTLTAVRDESISSSRSSHSLNQRPSWDRGSLSNYSLSSSKSQTSDSQSQKNFSKSRLSDYSLAENPCANKKFSKSRISDYSLRLAENPCAHKLSHLSQHTLEDESPTSALSQYLLEDSRHSSERLSQYSLSAVPVHAHRDSLTSVSSVATSDLSLPKSPPVKNLQNTLNTLQSYTKRRMDSESAGDHLKASHESANQTDDSQNVSPSRGFSSDDGSGWRSETTETSEGNISLSQYPLEVDEHVQEVNPEKEEFLSSAISEVSRDFISGNFSPSKYPAGSGESDSMSDGDHQVEPHQSGAVYARYPESATGMSDCEWNPYATESDNNFTPRSSASDGSPHSPVITTTATMQYPDSKITMDYIDRNNSALGRGNVPKRKSPEENRGNVSKSIFDEEYRLALQQPVSSYVLYPSDTCSSTTTEADGINRIDCRSSKSSSNATVDTVTSQTENQFIPSSYKESLYKTKQNAKIEGEGFGNPMMKQLIAEEQKLLVKSGSESDDTDAKRRPDPIGEISSKPGIAIPCSTLPDSAFQQTKSSAYSLKAAKSRDPVRVMASSQQGEKPQSGNDIPYVPIEERNKMLGYTHSLELSAANKPKDKSSAAAAAAADSEEPDALSQRVAKLLTDANQLGSTLHQSLYDKDALGLSEKEDFPKYKFSPVKSGLTTPSPTFSTGGPVLPDDLQRVRSLGGDDMTASLTSSLGEEVAKLMARTEAVSAKLKESKPSPSEGTMSFRPISVDKKPQESAVSDSVKQYYTQQNLKDKISDKDKHARHGLQESQESTDSLDQRVKEILQKTSYVEKMQPPAYRRTETSSKDPSPLDYSLLQRDLLEIQNSLDPNLRPEDKSEADKTTDTNALLESFKFNSDASEVESTKSAGKKLLWDHAGDLGIDESATGHFLGTMKSDADTEFSMKTKMTAQSSSFNTNTTTGKLSQRFDEELNQPEEEKNDSAVSDVVSEQYNEQSGHVAADVEEIIARYQGQGQAQNQPKLIDMEPKYQEDTSGLANRVFKILTQEPPEKQATGILEKAMQQERELLQKFTDRGRMDGSYDLQSADNSFAPRDQDIRRQLEWSEMSSLDVGHPDKTGQSEMSFKKVTDAPFSALGNAKTFLSSQLQKTSDRTFNHSIELRTPYRHAIECYPVYGVEKDKKEGAVGETRDKDVREAWPERKDRAAEDKRQEKDRILSQNPLASERFFLTALDTSPILPQRRYSDPRDLSPEARKSPERDHGHLRSKSEESRDLHSEYDRTHHRIEPAASLTDRRVSSSQHGYNGDDLFRRDRSESTLAGTRNRDSVDRSPPDSSPGSGESPGDSDNSGSRRSGSSKLRPYRPAGSKELYYTESIDDTTSIADSVTTAESTHTGSDDAIGPYVPRQHLGTRKDNPISPGIYGNKKSTDDGLSTIDERSLSDDRERFGHELRGDRASSRGSNPGSDYDKRDSGLDLTGRTGPSYDQMERPTSRTSDRQSDRSASSSKAFDRMSDPQRSGASGRLSAPIVEDSLSMTTRSDPGDQFATPKRRREPDLSSSSDHRLTASKDELYGRDKAKSRSETDLVTLSPGVTHKSSSPMYGARLMDLSTQPSPILSQHTTLNTPNVPQGSLRTFEEDRLQERPLEVGPNYVEAVTKLKDEDDRWQAERVEYSRPWDNVPDPQSRKSIEYKSDDKSLGTADTYQPYVGTDRVRGYQRTIEMGRELLQTRSTDVREEQYNQTRPLERGPDYDAREDFRTARPLEKGPDYQRIGRDPLEENRPLEEGAGLRREERNIGGTQSGMAYTESGYASRPSTDHATDILRNSSEERLRTSSEERLRTSSEERLRNLSSERVRSRETSAERRQNSSREALSEGESRREPVESARVVDQERGRHLDRGADYLDMFIPRSMEDPTHSDAINRQRSRSRSQERRDRSRSPGTNLSEDSTMKHYNIDGEIFTEPPKVPDDDFEEMVKAERLKVRKELEMIKLMKQKGKLLTEEQLKEFGAEYDCIPPSKRAVALREKLEKDCAKALPSNINDLWNRFKDMNDSQSDSSMNTSRIEELTNLLKNPTRHYVQRALDERTYQKVKERRVAEEIAALELEQRRDVSEGRRDELTKLRKKIRDDDSNGSYSEILAQQSNKKSRRDKEEKDKKERENAKKGNEMKKLGDSADTLYSIPEDTSFEGSRRNSPNVGEGKRQQDRVAKSKQKRQRHVIDPLMSKLKDKVQRQRDKIDKERRKELKRMDKLKKLEMLLTAKRKGQLTDKAIDVELQDVSSTSVPVSEDSTTFLDSTESTLTGGGSSLSDDSMRASINTSSKDSSLELQKTRVRKTKDTKQRNSGLPSDDSESQSDIIVVRKSKKTKPEKHGANKVRAPKEKKHVAEFLPEYTGKVTYESVSPSREKFRREKSPVRGKMIRDVGTMYPSPIAVSPPTRRRRPDKVTVRSEAIQTDARAMSPSHSDKAVIPVPYMSPETKRKSRSTSPSLTRRPTKSSVGKGQRSKSPSYMQTTGSPDSTANRSSIFSRSYSPPRSRSPPSQRSQSRESNKRSRSPPKSRMFVPESDSEYEKYLTSTPPKNKMFTPETPDDQQEGKAPDSPRGMAWYIPMDKELKPWKKPLREQQAHAVSKEPWQPKSIDPRKWKNLVNTDILNMSRGKNTQFDLDPSGHPMEKSFENRDSDEENRDPRPKIRTKMSLQEAFQIYKQDTISHLRARQKRVTLATEERKMQKVLEQERKEIFANEQRKKEANPEAHPYSENLHVPKRRVMSKEEMKELTKKSYKKLPEVVEQNKLKKRAEEYELNRLKARVFNRRIQKTVLKNRGHKC